MIPYCGVQPTGGGRPFLESLVFEGNVGVFHLLSEEEREQRLVVRGVCLAIRDHVGIVL